MPDLDLLIRNVTSIDGPNVNIGIRDSRFVSLEVVHESGERVARDTVDGSGLLALPGVIDPHVHLNWPFDIDEADIIRSETVAAAAGGITTVGYFPLGVRGDLLDHLRYTGQLIGANAAVDVAVAYPILNSAQIGQMEALVEAGVTGFKVLRPYTGSDVYDFGGTDDSLLYRVMLKVVEMRRNGREAIVKIHCENAALIRVFQEDLQAQYPDLGRNAPLTDVTWAHCRPPVVEAESVASALYLARMTGCPIVIVHLSSALSLEPIRAAKREGVEVYVETTPLYLETTAFTTGAPDGPAWTRVQPSVKFAGDSAALWEAVRDGTVDFIGSDHAATTKDVYRDRSVWDTGASGRSLLGIMLPVMLDAVARGKLTLSRLRQVMCETPALTLNLDRRQGRIAPGYDANVTLCDLSKTDAVTVASLRSRADHSPFEGRTLTGWPATTVLRGKIVWRNGGLRAEPSGEFRPGGTSA